MFYTQCHGSRRRQAHTPRCASSPRVRARSRLLQQMPIVPSYSSASLLLSLSVLLCLCVSLSPSPPCASLLLCLWLALCLLGVCSCSFRHARARNSREPSRERSSTSSCYATDGDRKAGSVSKRQNTAWTRLTWLPLHMGLEATRTSLRQHFGVELEMALQARSSRKQCRRLRSIGARRCACRCTVRIPRTRWDLVSWKTTDSAAAASSCLDTLAQSLRSAPWPTSAKQIDASWRCPRTRLASRGAARNRLVNCVYCLFLKHD